MKWIALSWSIILLPLMELIDLTAAECEYCDKTCDIKNSREFDKCMLDKAGSCCARRRQEEFEREQKKAAEQQNALIEEAKRNQAESQKKWDEDTKRDKEKFDENVDKAMTTFIIIGVLGSIVTCAVIGGIIYCVCRWSQGRPRYGVGGHGAAQPYPGTASPVYAPPQPSQPVGSNSSGGLYESA